MRGKGLVGTRVKLTSNLIDELPEHGHRLNAKTASPFSSQTIQIFIHPLSSFPPLNAIKKIAHTPAARTRSTTKVCILKHLLSVSARPYGQPIYRPTPP